MPHMQVEVVGPIGWIVLDGPYGGEIIPCDFCGELPDLDDFDGDEDSWKSAAFAQVADYAENRECWEIEQVNGYAGRLSAPGYLDCTDWIGPFDSAKDARREVINTYDLCPACEEYADSPKSEDNPACNFYHWE